MRTSNIFIWCISYQ